MINDNMKSNEELIKKQGDLISKLKTSVQPFILDSDDEPADEYVHFYFLGTHEGKEALFDTVLYTLRMQHESELFEIAEQKAIAHFPNYNKLSTEGDESVRMQSQDNLEEEIGLYMAEIMVELEEEGEVKVKEHVELDLEHDCGIGLDVGLLLEKITPTIIEQFIIDFNTDKLVLDDGLYSFRKSFRARKALICFLISMLISE